VYVIDDDAAVRTALRRVIATTGLRVELLDSAEAYLRRAAPSPPACLVLDVRMPGKGGLELQRALKATPHDLPIVFVSGHANERTRTQALSAGAVAVIDKPVDSSELLGAIASALRLSVEDPIRAARRIEDHSRASSAHTGR